MSSLPQNAITGQCWDRLQCVAPSKPQRTCIHRPHRPLNTWLDHCMGIEGADSREQRREGEGWPALHAW